jgi:hypothetical protein
MPSHPDSHRVIAVTSATRLPHHPCQPPFHRLHLRWNLSTHASVGTRSPAVLQAAVRSFIVNPTVARRPALQCVVERVQPVPLARCADISFVVSSFSSSADNSLDCLALPINLHVQQGCMMRNDL